MGELEALSRAHQLFADMGRPATVGSTVGSTGSEVDAALGRAVGMNVGGGQDRYRATVDGARAAARASAATDHELAAILSRAQRDHTTARDLTRAVLDAARADTVSPADSPVAQREAIKRRVLRLQAQQQHVLAARRRARRRLAVLLLLRYRARRRPLVRGRVPLPPPGTRAGIAVRAALSRLGRPYVWGATGPDKFDCSGLVQWSYRQSGIGLDRTTYDQINNGFAVPRSLVQPGDLVFPNAGHVQMAIGNGLVVEAPHAGANVRISQLGTDVVIRRPW
ncbi:C40 family peptidase [soil metagenome]